MLDAWRKFYARYKRYMQVDAFFYLGIVLFILLLFLFIGVK